MRSRARLSLPVGAERAGAALIAAVVLVLMLLHVAVFPESVPVVDSGRDIANAWAVATGSGFPATGPGIYRTWALGPAWYYVLAVPLALGGSLGVLALWVGVLAALKIPLAYLLGRHWYGPPAGLALAAVVALPGWSSAGEIVIVHTSVIEAAVFGSLLASSRALAGPGTARLVLAAGVFSLALHAHPIALVVAPWLVAAFVRRLRQGSALRPLALGLAVFLLPWLPMLVAEAMAGWPQLQATQRYASEGGFLARSAELLPGMRGLLTGWAPLVAGYLVPALASYEGLLALAWYAALALAVAGMLPAWRRRPWLTAALLANLVLGFWLVGVLRPGVRLYMLFAVFPLAAWTLVHGWQALAGRRALLVAGGCLALVAAALQAGVLLERRAAAARGWALQPGEAFVDVRAPVRDDAWIRFWLPLKDHERIARTLCGSSVAVHGELAAAFGWAQGVAIERVCGAARPQLGGRDADRHLAGTPAGHAQRLGLAGDPVGHGFVLSEAASVLHPLRGTPVAADTRYAVDEYRARHASPGWQDVALAFACPPGQVLVVANLMPVLNPLELAVAAASRAHAHADARTGPGLGVDANPGAADVGAGAVLDATGTDARSGAPGASAGVDAAVVAPIAPALRTIAADYYPCGDGMRLTLRARTLNPQALDVFLLETVR